MFESVWETGEYCTEGGQLAKVYNTQGVEGGELIGAVEVKKGVFKSMSWNARGKKDDGVDSVYDLVRRKRRIAVDATGRWWKTGDQPPYTPTLIFEEVVE